MDASFLIKVVTLIIAVSAATERIVEVLKGLLASFKSFTFGVWLNKQDTDETGETRRQLILHVLAAVFGVLTAYLARKAIEGGLSTDTAKVTDDNVCGWIWLIGICSSGGSSFWNSILGYLTKVKDVKAQDAAQAQAKTAAVKAQADADQAEAATKHAMHFIAANQLRQPLVDLSHNAAVGQDVQDQAAKLARQLPGG
jgi:hypothetical protein